MLVFLSDRDKFSCWVVLASGEEAVVFWAEIKCTSRPLNIKFFFICKGTKESAFLMGGQENKQTGENCSRPVLLDESMLNTLAGMHTHLNSSIWEIKPLQRNATSHKQPQNSKHTKKD